MMLAVAPLLCVDEQEVEFSAMRAQGAGGQLLASIAQVQLCVLLLDTGREREAQQQLRSALQVASGGGLLAFQELLLQQPGWLRQQLLAQARCPLVDAVLAALPEPQGNSGTTEQAVVEALSTRELAVLQLIAQGCSNLEISERLFISLHTVKTHARHINSKLGVERRTQAVARAKDLGLLR